MPKNIEDILPREKRSIRDIPIPNGRRRTDPKTSNATPVDIRTVDGPVIRRVSEVRERESQVTEETTELPRIRIPLERARAGRKGSKKTIWIASAIGVIVLVFAVLSFMRSSSLAYVPKTAPLAFASEPVTAYKTGQDGVLLFSVVKLSSDLGESVSASGDAVQVSKKASGTITVYNNNSASQALVATTRFQSSDGHIYRTPTAISIPAKTSAGPGSVSINVVADQPGQDYNIGLEDFTIPGFKGDPKFQTVYARSKTSMTGGFVGMQKSISDDSRSAAITDLHSKLKSTLLDQAKAQVPSDFILFPNLASVSYTDLSDSSSTDTSVTLNEHADLVGIMFKRSDLAAYFASNKLSLPTGQSIDVPDLENLAVSFAGDAPADLVNATSVNLTVDGNATAVWETDESALKSDLVGKSKSDLVSILKNYPGIASATAIIRPFWKSSFPADASEITIKENPWK